MKQSLWILPVVVVTAGALTGIHYRSSLKKWWRGPAKPIATAAKGQIITADAQIKILIKHHLQDIMDCYNGRIEHGLDKEGDLKISWEIDNQGQASRFQEMANDLDDSELYDCSAEAISQWNFPIGQPFFVHYTFHLKQKAKPAPDLAERGVASSQPMEDDSSALQIPALPPEQTHAATNSQ